PHNSYTLSLHDALPISIVRFVLGVDDALHGRAADRAWLSEFAVHRHLRTERRYPGRKILTGFSAQANRPLVEDGARSAVQSRDVDRKSTRLNSSHVKIS